MNPDRRWAFALEALDRKESEPLCSPGRAEQVLAVAIGVQPAINKDARRTCQRGTPGNILACTGWFGVRNSSTAERVGQMTLTGNRRRRTFACAKIAAMSFLKFSGDSDGWRFDLWQGSSSDRKASDDQALVTRSGAHYRFAVIDGVTSFDEPPYKLGLGRGLWAANVVRAALQHRGPAIECLERANDDLFDADLPRKLRPAATAVVADWGPTGLVIVRTGDCEAWEQSRSGAWKPIFAGRPFDPKVRGHRLSGAVGHWPDLLHQVSHRKKPGQIVLATDGARLRPERLADLDGWVSELRNWELRLRGRARKPHDDVTILRISPP